jgi:hypothetical protein
MRFVLSSGGFSRNEREVDARGAQAFVRVTPFALEFECWSDFTYRSAQAAQSAGAQKDLARQGE